MSGRKRIGPMFYEKHFLTPDQSRKLSVLVAAQGCAPTARLLQASKWTIEELASGGGTTKQCAERIGQRLDALQAEVSG